METIPLNSVEEGEQLPIHNQNVQSFRIGRYVLTAIALLATVSFVAMFQPGISRGPTPSSLFNSTVSKVEVRVAHGKQIRLTDWHDQQDFVALVKPGRFICTGTVSKNKVLTAKHCVEKLRARDVKVQVSSNRNADVPVVRIDMHPSRDVAILTLRRQHTNKKKIILDGVIPVVGEQIRLTGFGENHKGTAGRELHTTGPMQRTRCNFGSGIICAGSGSSSQTSSCGGDSGGPWFQFRDGRALVELIGVNSFGFKGSCGQPQKQTGLVSVAGIKNWILSKAPEFEFTDNIGCSDADNGAKDNDGDGCQWYTEHDHDGDQCGKHDDDDFQANTMCCRCGGGSSACSDTDNGAKDNDGDSCEWYTKKDQDGSECGKHDDSDFKAKAMCCRCGGGTR